MPQTLACAFFWVSPAMVHANLTSSIALELCLFSSMSHLSMLKVMRASCCGHCGRHTLLTCDRFFKITWHVVSQGKVVKQQPFLKMCICVNVKRRHWGLWKMWSSLYYGVVRKLMLSFLRNYRALFLIGKGGPTSVSEIHPRSLALTQEAS